MTPLVLSFYFILTTCWIFSMVAPILVTRWSFKFPGRKFHRSLGFSLGAIVIAILGATTYYVTSTATNNGKITRYDTRWLFLAALILNIAALAHAIWKKAKAANVTATP